MERAAPLRPSNLQPHGWRPSRPELILALIAFLVAAVPSTGWATSPNPQNSFIPQPGPMGTLHVNPIGTQPSLASLGLSIDVVIRDNNDLPCAGLATNLVSLLPEAGSNFSFCGGPPHPDFPSTMTGLMSFTGALAGSGYTPSLLVTVEGEAVTGISEIAVVSSDIDADGRVDLCDLRILMEDTPGGNPRSDFNGDGLTNLMDLAELGQDIHVTSCPGAPVPVVGAGASEAGVYFDAAGMVDESQVSTSFDVYLIAKSAPGGISAFEYQLELPANVQDPQFFPSETYDGVNVSNQASYGYQVATGGCQPATDYVMVRRTLELVGPVVGGVVSLQALTPTSFGNANAPCYLTCATPCDRQEFTTLTSAIINPSFAGASWSCPPPLALQPNLNNLLLTGTVVLSLLPEPATVTMGTVDQLRVGFANPVIAQSNLRGGVFRVEARAQEGTVGSLTYSVPLTETVFHTNPVFVVGGNPTANYGASLYSGTNLVVSLSGQSTPIISDRVLPPTMTVGVADGEVTFVEEWGSSRQFTLGGQVYTGDRLLITSESGQTFPSQTVDTVGFTGSLFPEVELVPPAASIFGNFFSAPNALSTSAGGGLVTVTMVPQFVTDIFTELTPGAEELFWRPLQPSTSNPLLDIRFLGDVDGLPGSSIGRIKVEDLGRELEVSVDFADPRPAAVRLRILNGGVLVHEEVGTQFDPLTVTTASWPASTGVGMQPSAEFVLGWTGPVDFTVASKMAVQGDELVVILEEPLTLLGDTDEIELQLRGFEVIEFKDPTIVAVDGPRPLQTDGPILHANVPNPFNPSTEISFELIAHGLARLEVFDSRGRLVRTLMRKELPAGRWTQAWNGLDDGGRRVASGVYRVRLTAGGQVASRSVTLLK